MSGFASAADAPSARAVIYTMGFDEDIVQQTVAQSGGNEELAIHLILNGEVLVAASGSTSVASIAAPAAGFSGPTFGIGAAAPSVGPSSAMSSNVLSFTDRLTVRPLSLALVADGKLLSPAQLRLQIKRPLELMKAAA
jgi:hypothetical protein